MDSQRSILDKNSKSEITEHTSSFRAIQPSLWSSQWACISLFYPLAILEAIPLFLSTTLSSLHRGTEEEPEWYKCILYHILD